MKRLIEFQSEDGGIILMEVEEPESEPVIRRQLAALVVGHVNWLVGTLGLVKKLSDEIAVGLGAPQRQTGRPQSRGRSSGSCVPVRARTPLRARLGRLR